MRALLLSTTRANVPSGEKETPEGPRNVASVPGPSITSIVCGLWPMVVTTRDKISIRRKRPAATMANLPSGEIAIPRGYAKDADVPVPSSKPAESDPASVVTTPVPISMCRMRWPP